MATQKPRNIIIDNTGDHLTEGYKLVSTINRNNEYVVCDLSLNEDINDSSKTAVFSLISPFNLMFMRLLERMELAAKSKKPIIVYGLPSAPSLPGAGEFSLRILEYTYLCSFLLPIGFVRVRVCTRDDLGKGGKSVFPTIDYDPSSMFLVDLMDSIEKTYEANCRGNVTTMIDILHCQGFYLSMVADPKKVVKMSGYGSSTQIFPYEYFSKVFSMMEDSAGKKGVMDILKETAFVRAHSPIDAIVSMKV